MFTWVLGVLDGAGLIKGKTLGVDATTLEANAAMRSIVRREDGRTYQRFLDDLAKASGIETPTREDLARPSGACLEATPGNLYCFWCERAFKCQALADAATFGDLGMSVNECVGRPSPFMQVLYTSLGGVDAAEDVQRMNRPRFGDCSIAVLYRADCDDLLADSSLLMEGGYCSASHLKGETTTLLLWIATTIPNPLNSYCFHPAA